MEEDHEECTGINQFESGTWLFWMNELRALEENS